jgi:hypothetical protein
MKYFTTWSANEGGCGHLHRSFRAAQACCAHRGRRVYAVTGRSAIKSDRVRFFREPPGVMVSQCPECGAPLEWGDEPLCPECGALR